MLANVINYAVTELNSGIIVAKSVTDRDTTPSQDGTFTIDYRPTAIKIYNQSSSTVYIGAMSTNEYNYWAVSPATRGDLIPITANNSEIFNTLKYEVTMTIVSGVAGAYTGTSGVVFVLLQE